MAINIYNPVSTEPHPANEQQLREKLEQNSADWDSRQQLAHLLYDQGSFDQAATLIWEADEIPSTDLDIAFAARILAKTQPRKAIRLLTAVLEHNRGKAVQNLGVANALLHHGMVIQSARFYGAALEADPSLVNPDLEHFVLWTDDQQSLWGDFKNRRPKLGELPWMARDPMEALKLTSRISLHTTPIRVPTLKQTPAEELRNDLYQQTSEKGAEITPPPAVTIPADRVQEKHRRFDSTYGAADHSPAEGAAQPAAEAAPAPSPAPAPLTPPPAAPKPKLVTPGVPTAPKPKLVTEAPAAQAPEVASAPEAAPSAARMQVVGRPGSGTREADVPEIAADSPARALAEREAQAAEEKARAEEAARAAEEKERADREALAAASIAEAKAAEKTRAVMERALAAEEASANLTEVPKNPRPGAPPPTTQQAIASPAAGSRLLTPGAPPAAGGRKLLLPGQPQQPRESLLNPAAGVPVPSDAHHGEWYYIMNGEACGPVHPEELKEKLEDKTIQPPLKMIWTTGMDNWKPVYECPELWEENAGQVFGR